MKSFPSLALITDKMAHFGVQPVDHVQWSSKSSAKSTFDRRLDFCTVTGSCYLVSLELRSKLKKIVGAVFEILFLDRDIGLQNSCLPNIASCLLSEKIIQNHVFLLCIIVFIFSQIHLCFISKCIKI